MATLDQASATPTAAATSTLPSLSINVDERLSAADSPEKKEQIIFQWLSGVERDLSRADDTAAIAAAQVPLERQLFKFLTSSTPRPTRQIRQLIGRIYVQLYVNGDSHSLFDCLTSVQGVLNQKKLDDINVKIAVIHCIGVISEHVGTKVILRREILVSLAKVLRGCGKGATDIMIRDISKVAKAALLDKTTAVRIVGAEEEFDLQLTPLFKAIEGSNYHSRRAISNVAGLILSYSQCKKPKVPTKKGAKAPPTQTEGGNVEEGTVLTVEEMCSLVSAQYSKAVTKEVKVGIFEAYGDGLRELGVGFVEANYTTLTKHVLDLLTRKDPGLVLSAAKNGQLEEQLFALLDAETDRVVRDEIKDILRSLVRHVAPHKPSRWVDLCKTILAKGGSAAATSLEPPNTVADEDDEDVEVGAQEKQSPKKKEPDAPALFQAGVVLLPRWQTQVFALTCLREVLAVALASGKAEHFDLNLARNTQPGTDCLILRLSDLIRLAFNSATAPIYNLRLEGLYFLSDILEV
ncbi:HEAT repeat-containing protein 5B [Cladochytrium tenue]|nr:HEAT repeat-containing protein 5B [Cladochytrium tenue]